MNIGFYSRRLLFLAALTLLGNPACGPSTEPGPDSGPVDAGTPVADAALDATTAGDTAAVTDATAADRTATTDSTVGVDAASADAASADDSSEGDAASDAALAADATGADLASSDVGPAEGGGGLWCTSPSTPILVGITAEELHSMLQNKDFLLINVADSTGDQIPGTDTFIAHSDTTGLTDYIGADLDTKVVLYCASGGRSGIAGDALVELGYCSVQHLLGGRGAWAAAGYSFE